MKYRVEVAVRGHPGIAKIWVLDRKGNYIEPRKGRYRAVKRSLLGTRQTKCFQTLQEARLWKQHIEDLPSANSYAEPTAVENTQPNAGLPLFSDVYFRYMEHCNKNLTDSTMDYKKHLKPFFEPLFEYHMDELTSELINEYLLFQKRKTPKKSSRRCNFNNELTEFKALLAWYQSWENPAFITPVLKSHFELGTIEASRSKKNRDVKMKPQQVSMFFDALKKNCDILYYDMAVVQFYVAGRIGEIAGLQKNYIDLNDRTLTIKDVVMWDKNKNFLGLKDKPKNGEPRYCLIVEPMVDSLQRQMLKSPAKCNYVFQIKGQPIPYRHIQSNYNRALKACGLYSQFKSTHILRHAAASIIRTQMGNLDYVQAITGHLDIRMAQLYAGAPDEKQKEAAQKLAEIIQKNADQK